MARADRHAADVLPVIEDIQAGGVTSLKGIATQLNARGILTARGGQWYATTVRNLLARSPRCQSQDRHTRLPHAQRPDLNRASIRRLLLGSGDAG